MIGEKVRNFCGSLTKKFFFCFIIFYLASHLVGGKNGVVSYIKQERELSHIDAKLSKITAERDKIQNKVDRLYTHSLDIDLLDEQYRRSTGEIKESEIIYYY